MKTHNESKLDTTGRNPDKRQVGVKTGKRRRVRSGQGTIAFWKEKVFNNNSYKDRHGVTWPIKEYYVRLRHDGITKKVKLHTADKDKAAEEAMLLAAQLADEGWSAVTKGQARLPSSPTIEKFCEAYEKAAASMENPPRKISVALYLRHLKQVCALAGVKQLRELTPEAAERARDNYRAQGRAAKRQDTAVQNSIGIILRNEIGRAHV